MQYQNYQYIYPPRPENNIPPTDLNFWDKTKSLMAQPKLNGSNCLVFIKGKDLVVMNRHGQRMSNFNLSKNELEMFSSDKGWNVLNGEWMNKGQYDENGNLFNNKLVLFDYLVNDGDYMIGKSFEYRYNLLKDKFNSFDYNNYMYQLNDNIYLVKSFKTEFDSLFNNFIEIGMLEGLVLKRSNARLERGSSQKNNIKSQLKCRKSNKNYKY